MSIQGKSLAAMQLEEKLRGSRRALCRQVNKLFKHVFRTDPINMYQAEQIKANVNMIHTLLLDTINMLVVACRVNDVGDGDGRRGFLNKISRVQLDY